MARAAPTTVVYAESDLPGTVLESPRTNDVGESEWARVCLLPCDELRLDAWEPYRIGGSQIVTSALFHLLPTEGPQFPT
jgi:hypothetical protein